MFIKVLDFSHENVHETWIPRQYLLKFKEFMNGQTMSLIEGENVYHLDDVDRFYRGLDATD